MRACASISLALFALALNAQVRVDKRIELTGADPASRQVNGLDPAQAPTHALEATSAQAGAAHWAGEGSGVNWSVSIASIAGAPTAGTAITVRTADSQPGAVSLLLNGQGPYAVLRSPGAPLNAQEVEAGTLLSLVFDGTAFQVTNGVAHLRRPCPPGLTAVTGHYCIEPQERPASDWYTAARTCAQEGLRLCTWSEWEQACLRRVELGLAAMVGNWEWSNNTANEDLNARMVGQLSCTHVGTRAASDNTLVSRCCYTR